MACEMSGIVRDAFAALGHDAWSCDLLPTERVAGRVATHNGKQVERWGNQTDSGQNKLTPSVDRWKERARTYQGWADAMAEQWGGLCLGGGMRVVYEE